MNEIILTVGVALALFLYAYILFGEHKLSENGKFNEPPKITAKEYEVIEVKSEFVVGIRSYHNDFPTGLIIRELCEGLMDEIIKNDAVSVKTTYLENGEIKHEASMLVAKKENNNG